jgi:hypothetical protein
MSRGSNVAVAIALFIPVVAMSSGSSLVSTLAIAVFILAVGAIGPAYFLAKRVGPIVPFADIKRIWNTPIKFNSQWVYDPGKRSVQYYEFGAEDNKVQMIAVCDCKSIPRL